VGWSRDIANEWWDPLFGELEWWLFVLLFWLLLRIVVRPKARGRVVVVGATIAYLAIFASPIGLRSHDVEGHIPPKGAELLDTHAAHTTKTIGGVPFGSMRLYRRHTYWYFGPTAYTADNAFKVRTGLLPHVPPLLQTNGAAICGQRDDESCIDETSSKVLMWRQGRGFRVLIARRTNQPAFKYDAFHLTYGIVYGFWIVQWSILGLLLLAHFVRRRRARDRALSA
jgi:hypothetical protein